MTKSAASPPSGSSSDTAYVLTDCYCIQQLSPTIRFPFFPQSEEFTPAIRGIIPD